MCGECVLDRTAGICPVTTCPKGLLNGPCGGMWDGMCEVLSATASACSCASTVACEPGARGRERDLPPKDYSAQAEAGLRRRARGAGQGSKGGARREGRRRSTRAGPRPARSKEAATKGLVTRAPKDRRKGERRAGGPGGAR